MGPAGAGKTSRGAAALIRLVLMLSFAATLSGCGGMPPGMGTSTPASANKSLTSISLSPVAATVALGQSQQFTATGVFSDGSKQDLTQVVSWSSAPPSVASISQSGLVLGKLTGSATITARSGTITASDTLVISPAVLMSIAVSPQTVSVPKGAAKQLTAIATFSDGSQQNLNELSNLVHRSLRRRDCERHWNGHGSGDGFSCYHSFLGFCERNRSTDRVAGRLGVDCGEPSRCLGS